MFNKITKTTLAIGFTFLFSHSAMSATITESEPNNPIQPFFIDSAFNIDPYLTSEFNANIGDRFGNNISEIASHVSILGTGDGTYDYYSFTVNSAGITGVFDIDFGSTRGSGSVDTEIALWNDKGTVLSSNDDFSTIAGANGSSSTLDSFIQYTFLNSGTYVIGVAKFNSTAGNNGWTGNVLGQLDTYTLNIALGTNFASVGNIPSPVPVPPAVILFLSGILSMIGFRRIPKKYKP